MIASIERIDSLCVIDQIYNDDDDDDRILKKIPLRDRFHVLLFFLMHDDEMMIESLKLILCADDENLYLQSLSLSLSLYLSLSLSL